MQPTKPDNFEELDNQYAGTFLVTESGEILGQLRDDIPNIDEPGRVGSFGGAMEPEDETPLQGALRELGEETNLEIDPFEMRHLVSTVGWRRRMEYWEGRHIFYLTIPDETVSMLEIYEGQGWTVITGADDPRLMAGWPEYVQLLQERLALD
jgi:8-oxo-dGTP pyrophosphatase MutT (NUDIX family)